MASSVVWVIMGLLTTHALATQVHRFRTTSHGDHALIHRFVQDHPQSEIWDSEPNSHVDVMLQDHHLPHASSLPLQSSVFIQSVEALVELSESGGDSNNFHAKYHSSAEYGQFLKQLARQHQHTKLVHLGKSTHGKPITGLRIGDPSKPEIMLQGGQHAREWISPGALAYLAEQLSSNQLKDHSVLVVPVVNPDGYDYTRTKGSGHRLWRKNLDDYSPEKEELMETLVGTGDKCFGTDLNRNWASGKSFSKVQKGEEVSSSECSSTYQGKSPLSELEVSSMAKYVQDRQKQGAGISHFVDVHSYSQKIIPAGCNNQKLSESAKARNLRLTQNVASAMSQPNKNQYTTGECAEIMYACSGVAHDWAHFDGKVPNSMAIELPDRGRYGFLVPPAKIQQTGQEMVAAVQSMADTHAEMELELFWSERN